jgi:hypothetical protein
MRGRVGVPVTSDGRLLPAMGRRLALSTSTGTSVAAGASNVTGSWVEVIANIGTTEAHFVVIDLFGTTQGAGAAATALLDVGIGAAAAETAVVSSVSCGQITNTVGLWSIVLPVRIPAGSRLAVRITAATASPPTATVRVSVFGRSVETPHLLSPPNLVAVGANTAASKGVDTGAANAWVELTSATTQPFQGIIMSAGGIDASMGAGSRVTDLGIGPSGAEVVLTNCIAVTAATETVGMTGSFLPVEQAIPVGVRLAVRSDSTDVFTVVALGIPYT